MSRTPRAVAEGPPFQRRDRTRPDVVRNREQIRTAVGELFALDGLSVSMTAIRKTAGLSTSTLYRHYSTKAALVADVMLEPITAWTEAVAGVPAGPADDRLAAMLSASAEHQSKTSR